VVVEIVLVQEEAEVDMLEEGIVLKEVRNQEILVLEEGSVSFW